mgnify:CR=1 FL=1
MVLYSPLVPDVYRRAASVVLLRLASVCTPGGCGVVYEVLLLHKPRKRDAWQLPQGGVEEGETIEQAAFRELEEETGISGAELLGESEHRYQYDFPASYRRYRPDNVCGQCIAYVFALAPERTDVRVDGKEVDSHVWVIAENLGKYIRRKKYFDIVKKLVAEASALLQRSR